MGRQIGRRKDEQRDVLVQKTILKLQSQATIKVFLNMLIRFPIVRPENVSLKIVRSFTKKKIQSELIYSQTKVTEATELIKVPIYGQV
jgi:hypothetical protein